jgi:CO/xanthine dehydrogenase Mo-binding subunit
MGESAIGQSVLRREDPRLLRGQGRLFDDLKLADRCMPMPVMRRLQSRVGYTRANDGGRYEAVAPTIL